ncbi:hypothetical protein NKH77_51515 [Streptomyces sp. M19]
MVGQFVEFALQGLTSGGAYALVALSLVAVHRGTGVVNFAQAAIGMASTYVFWKLFAHAGLPLPRRSSSASSPAPSSAWLSTPWWADGW